MSDDIFILGINMTKFGKHPDKDTVDLAAEAAHGRPRRRRRHHEGHGHPRRRQPHGRRRADRPDAAEADRPDRHPRLQRANACATGATALRTAIMAVKAGECDMGLAVGVEKLSGAGLLGGRWHAQERQAGVRAARVATAPSPASTVASAPDTMPGMFAQIGMEYGHKYGGTSFELFAKISEKNHATPR